MKIDDSVDWYVDSNICAEVVRGGIGGVDSEFCASGYGEGV